MGRHPGRVCFIGQIQQKNGNTPPIVSQVEETVETIIDNPNNNDIPSPKKKNKLPLLFLIAILLYTGYYIYTNITPPNAAEEATEEVKAEEVVEEATEELKTEEVVEEATEEVKTEEVAEDAPVEEETEEDAKKKNA